MSGLIGPVLITGGGGFLGRALAKALLHRGETVVSLDLNIAPDAPGHPRLHHVAGDIRDADDLHRVASAHGIRAIVHLAALVIPACRANPVLGVEVNVIGHLNILELARTLKIGRLVYTSSAAALPRGPMNAPANLYGVLKHCCEQMSKVWFLDHGVPSIGLRPNIVFGPGRESGETAAITLAMAAAARGDPYEIPFTGEMCFQHVDEVTEIFLRCLSARPEKPVVSDLTTETRSIDEVIAAIRTLRPEARITARPAHRAAPQTLDNSALRALLGPWQPVTLEDGTRRTIETFTRQNAGSTRGE